ncbi:MAG TPA: hypothetical protein VIK26_11075 [Clostridium sp.]
MSTNEDVKSAEVSKLQVNLDKFNEVVAMLMQRNAVQVVIDRLENQLEEEQVDLDSIRSKTSLSFGVGKDFLDISETNAVIGLSEEVILGFSNVNTWGIFDTRFKSREEASRKTLADSLAVYVQPYMLVKVPKIITKGNYLNIFTREKLYTVMRRSFNTYLRNLRTGLGYFETHGELGIFCIIEKKAIKASDMRTATEDLIYIDNTVMTDNEIKEGLNKIEISFRIYPFNKKTNEPTATTLEQIWTSVNANPTYGFNRS